MTPPPVPSAQPGEHQYWTDPILCEETRARLEHFRSLGWLPPNYKPKTLEGLAVVERYWRKYCIQLNQDYIEYLLLEDQAIYMNFFDWIYKTSWKKLLQSYDEYWRRLCQYFGLFARHRVNSDVHEQMQQFLEHKKNTLDVDVFCITYCHYWVYSKHFRHRIDDLPALVCYCDIKLFYLKDLDSKRDVLCTIIKFRNLKGWPEAYCPINQIISLAFRDEAFLNTVLTPELIWQLRSLPMIYDSRNFTSQEQQRVLGQSGDAHVVLLRPSQEGLLRVAESMLRKRDPLALSILTDAQKHTICQTPEVLELRQEKRELIEEM
ncbi:hypothetical protein BDW59DRAFT_170777 [Aspergillus cavernicola]|uniref:Uncharacterized protein n=1 Tax=Aspergillus cavernicola TaxID=176166 RepID=A0ABR4IMR6_9EURO